MDHIASLEEDHDEELKDNIEQLMVMVERGEVRASSVHADFYRPVDYIDGKYRTHAILIDVLE
jgi:hypothetical protein